MKQLICYLCLCGLAVGMTACHTPHHTDAMPADGPIPATGLSNQKIHALAEDAQGHIWIGTFRGLNKYDGHEYRQYFCNDDSTSLPDNQITDILCDRRGRLWVSTVGGVCRYTERDGFHHVPILADNRNGRQLLESRTGDILVSTLFQLYRYREADDCLECVIPNFDPQFTFSGRCYINSANELWDVKRNCLRCFDASTLRLRDSIGLGERPLPASCMDADERLWLAGEGEVRCFDTRTRRFIGLPREVNSHPLLHSSTVSLLHPYAGGLLLYTNERGLFYYSWDDRGVVHQDERGFPFEAPRFRIQRLFTDRQGNLWMGSLDQGYAVSYRYKERFGSNNYLRRRLEGKSVLSMAADHGGRLWIATLMDGLYVYDAARGEIGSIDPPCRGKREPGWLFTDRDGRLWMAAEANSVMQCRITPEGGLCTERTYQLPMPMAMAQTADGTIWVGTASQYIFYKRTDDTEFSPLQAYTGGYTFIPALLPMDDTGELLAAGFMQPMVRVDTRTLAVSTVELPDEEYRRCIRRSVPIPTVMRRTTGGDIYIGTVSNGLLRYSPATQRMQPVEGIGCNDISSIEEDGSGRLWVSTQQGLDCLDPTDGTVRRYDAADGIGGNQFYDRSSCRLADGTLLFGGTHGLTIFHPGETHAAPQPRLLFEELKVHNRPVRPRQGGCIDRHLSYRPEVRLRHDQNSIGIAFTALDYGEHRRMAYRYRLEGFDRDWIEAGHNHEAYYGHLPAGHYTFRLQASAGTQGAAPAESSLHIRVRPAPWDTWWARTLYVLAAAGLAALYVRGRRRIRAEKEAARRAEEAREQERRINRMNMSFFGNISHEFRTPLTMIAGPVRQLAASATVGEADRRLLHVVERSTERMLRLVGQLMDFGRLENDTLRLHVERMDVVGLLRQLVEVFRPEAERRGIALAEAGLEGCFTAWVDADKLEKIVSNLMSNALKFTPAGGRIELALDVAGQEMRVSVADTGCGIPEGETEKIFRRYYQAANSANGQGYNWGTGIGLYYARSLARLHQGDLCAANRTEGGALFTLVLPAGEGSYTEEQRAPAGGAPQRTTLPPLPAVPPEEAAGDGRSHRPLVVVDDDAEVLDYLRLLLGGAYRVQGFASAEEAFGAIRREAPELVVSDVLMPGTSGYELCRRMKEDLQLCHIPVVLLTAKSSVEEQVEGLDCGADAYVVKPFDPAYLLALIKSQLANRAKVRALLEHATLADEQVRGALSEQDSAFMEGIYELMEAELSNPELNISLLTERLHISRTKFYYKIKGLTGCTPDSFFKTYKLNRAAQLLEEGRYTMAEIADRTGFSTPSLFSTNFKRKFGCTPSEYVRAAEGAGQR